MMKKAKQDCESSRTNSSFPAILQQYHDVTDADEREATGIYESKNSKYAGNQANGGLLQRIQRVLDELDLDQFTLDDLVQIEKELETAYVQTRAAKISVNTRLMMEPLKTLQEKVKLLKEENEALAQQIAAMVKENVAAQEKSGEIDRESCNLARNGTPPPNETLVFHRGDIR